MDQVTSLIPLLAVLASLAAIPGIISARNENVREAWTFLAGAIKFGLVISLLPTVLAGREIVFTLVEILPGLPLAFKVDALGMLFALVSSSLWILTSAYSIGYMRGLDEHSQTRYFTFFAIALSATIGVAFSANLLTLYLFYEVLSLATYPLVTHHQDGAAKSAGRKYLTYILGTSIGLVLPGMLIIHHLTGTLEFSATGLIGEAGQELPPPGVLVGLVLAFFFGFAKAGIMPFHSWLPAAMVAPTPVSALLHAVAVVKVGVFCILRTMTGVFGMDLLKGLDISTALCWIASITILVSSLIALSQDGLKRRLAFSTIGQLSYIVLGTVLLTPKALTGAAVHIALHAFGKITLFMCAGAIFVHTGKKNISEMRGLGRRMPVIWLAFLLGSLSVIGLPPLGGFLSKWNLLIGALDSGQTIFLAVLLVSSFLNAAYFLPVVYRAFFCVPEDPACEGPLDEAGPWLLFPPVITGLVSIWLFFHPEPFFRLAEMGARAAFGGG